MNKLERAALEADLAAVQALLSQRTREEDPIGWMHFQSRVKENERRLQAITAELDTTASVALFFGGRPVIGSRGIDADFGGKALEHFQNAVSTQLAALQGTVGARGPIQLRARGQLLVTDVARGSIGFVLEEAQPESQLVDSQVKSALDGVVDAIHRIGSPDEDAFEAAIEAVDNRVLSSVKAFFKLMDEAGATLRIVEGHQDFSFQREAVEVARKRIDDLEIDEDTIEETGIFYLLPDSRRFELHLPDGGVLRGTLSPEVSEQLIDVGGTPQPGIIGSSSSVRLIRRKITTRRREPRFSYKLIEFHSPDRHTATTKGDPG
jgi:hypothetical protein